ncbi:MAG: hypothetical protein QM770_20695 [Tepidisphaeraceae bacterium]
MFQPLGALKANRAVCSCDGATVRRAVLFHTIRGDEAFLDRTLASSGVPAFDIVGARSGDRYIGLELSADASATLGPLPAEGLQWL